MTQEAPVLLAEIAAPTMNLLGPELVCDLVSLIQETESQSAVQVLVFKSADPDYFISHVDVTRIGEYRDDGERADAIAPLSRRGCEHEKHTGGWSERAGQKPDAQ